MKQNKTSIWKKVLHFFYEKKREKLFKKAMKGSEVSLNKRDKNKKAPKKKRRRNIVILKEYLRKSGYEYASEKKVTKNVFKVVIFACFILTIVFGFLFLPTSILKFFVFLFGTWTVGVGLFLGLFWMFLYVYFDLKIYNRTKQLEDVLPDFLQLTSANISAGMPIDQALWYAVRPRFGVLAKEIEEVAKSVIAGDDLEIALKTFADKYDSKILKRSVNLIIEGMKAGGELADLLSKISINIQETKLMKKEIAASIMTYVIFITFATIVAAPFLFALSTQLLQIVQSIMGSIDLGGASTGSFSFKISGDSIAISDFKIFSMLALTVSAFFSAAIVSIIQKGNIRDGWKNIPIFIIVSLILYFIGNAAVGSMMGSFI
jgi:Flp pilus assembly protein TadB